MTSRSPALVPSAHVFDLPAYCSFAIPSIRSRSVPIRCRRDHLACGLGRGCRARSQVFSFGDARWLGSAAGQHLNAPMVSMTPTASGQGYWLFADDGGVFSYGDAQFYGSMGGQPLNAPIVRSST